jgi:hypothetical protein
MGSRIENSPSIPSWKNEKGHPKGLWDEAKTPTEWAITLPAYGPVWGFDLRGLLPKTHSAH